MIEGRKDYMNWVSDQVSKRLAKETDRPDFMTYITSHNGEKGTTLSKDRLDSNANLILTAGSETTATLLSGATYLVSSIESSPLSIIHLPKKIPSNKVENEKNQKLTPFCKAPQKPLQTHPPHPRNPFHLAHLQLHHPIRRKQFRPLSHRRPQRISPLFPSSPHRLRAKNFSTRRGSHFGGIYP